VAEWSQFDEMNEKKPIECAVCEALCPDAVDGTLTELDRRMFERHVAHCANCARELEEARRGAAWLEMLKGHTPEPPAALLAKILAETTGTEETESIESAVPEFVPPVPVREPAPAWALSSILLKVVDVFRIEKARATFQPRMAMTAAMAFVSIALTLNLTGVRLKNLRAADFTPSGIRRNVIEVGASAARNFQNNRMVYQVESRVSELRGEGPLAQREDTDYTVPQNSTAQPQNGATQQQPEQAAPAPHKKGL
jgi:hypothetical protein